MPNASTNQKAEALNIRGQIYDELKQYDKSITEYSTVINMSGVEMHE